MYLRRQIFEGSGSESLFLWGARQTGKTTLLKLNFTDSLYVDLLKNDVYLRFKTNPALLREMILADERGKLVIIDEIQRIPELLNEIQWLITETNTRFILSGSSPRKIIREGHNLLGGRALRYELYPLVYPEIGDFELFRALKHGLIPRHYLSENPGKLIGAYIGSYLKDEIAAEAKIRNIVSFSQFLEKAAFSNGEIVNYSAIATDCGVSSPTIKEYFQILEDTLIGRFLPSYQKKAKRRVVLAPKFFFFDVGIANFLRKWNLAEPGTEVFGKAFEHFMYQELFAHCRYSDLNYHLAYWRTASGIKVDYILGDAEVAIEVKSVSVIQPRHLKGLGQFREEFNPRKCILVSLDPIARKVGDIDLMHWKSFLEQLWNGMIIS